MIGIIGFSDLYLMQYLYKYTNVLDANNIEYEVLFWNRSGMQETEKKFKGTIRYFDVRMNTYQPFQKKIVGFLRYSLYLRRMIAKKRYDKLIILTTQTAVPLSDILLVRYKRKYIYDYRDITKERKFRFYRALVKELIKSSYCTMMSSMGFLKALGLKNTERIVQAHNTQINEKSTYKAISKSDSGEPIRITFWGMVRQIHFNKKLCDALGNDDRFVLAFHGVGETEELESYCKSKGYRNCCFSGKYTHDEIPGFAANTNIVHCLYENDEQMIYALQVKIYDAIKFRLPIIVSEGSYASEYLKPYGVAMPINMESSVGIGDQIYEWYKEIDIELVGKNYEMLEKNVFQEDTNFSHILMNFVRKNEAR